MVIEVPKKLQIGESIVFVGDTPQKLRYGNEIACLSVRTKSRSQDPGNVVYLENVDFVIDSSAGMIARTQKSSIPDWNSHVLCGKSGFDHRDYTDCSNRLYTVYVDYEYTAAESESMADLAASQTSAIPLQRVGKQLAANESVRYVIFGDSISAGGDASRDEYAFYQLFAGSLRGRFGGAKLEVVNKAVGGENSSTGLTRLEEDVIAMRPDLVSIGYGMNDQCTMSEEIRNGIPPGLFEHNIRQMVELIREKTDADVILVTPCESNPLWKHSSGDLAIYADILKRLGQECGVAVADVHRLWHEELKSGKTHESLLLNNINHPNDYGHRIYYDAFAPLIDRIADEVES